MAEKQEVVHIVMRRPKTSSKKVPSKAFDDRKDAREYARRLNRNPNAKSHYSVVSVKKG
jgi:hypothetical protein